jgi:hypothetical protein
MSRKLNLALALTAGLFGGLLSHYLTPATVFAQPNPPREIVAQSFVLADGRGKEVGRFTFDRTLPPPNRPVVVLLDPEGHEIWRAGSSIHPLTTR